MGVACALLLEALQRSPTTPPTSVAARARERSASKMPLPAGAPLPFVWGLSEEETR